MEKTTDMGVEFKKCNMCDEYREHVSTQETKKSTKYWRECYCVAMKFYNRYVSNGRYGLKKLTVSKDLRKGNCGITCLKFKYSAEKHIPN